MKGNGKLRHGACISGTGKQPALSLELRLRCQDIANSSKGPGTICVARRNFCGRRMDPPASLTSTQKKTREERRAWQMGGIPPPRSVEHMKRKMLRGLGSRMCLLPF